MSAGSDGTALRRLLSSLSRKAKRCGLSSSEVERMRRDAERWFLLARSQGIPAAEISVIVESELHGHARMAVFALGEPVSSSAGATVH